MAVCLADDIFPRFMMEAVYRKDMNRPFREIFVGIPYDIGGLYQVKSIDFMADINNMNVFIQGKDAAFYSGNSVIQISEIRSKGNN